MRVKLRAWLTALAVTVGAVTLVWWAGPVLLTASTWNWQTPENLSNTSKTTDNNPRLRAYGQTVYVVWGEQIGDSALKTDPFYTKSTDGGISWISPTVNISSSINTHSTNVTLAIGEDGKPHFVWSEAEGGKYNIHYRYDVNPPVVITRTDGLSFQPAVVVANNKVHVAWTEFSSVIVYASKWVTDTWQNVQIENISTFDPGVAHVLPDIAVGGDGTVHVVWDQEKEGGGDYFVYYNRRISTTGWLSPTNILSPTYTSGVFDYPAIDTHGDSVYVIYSHNVSSPSFDKQYVDFVKSTDRGQTWSVPITIAGPLGANTLAPGDISPDVTVDDQGHVRAVWSGTKAGEANEDIFYSHSVDEGDTWTAADRVTDSSANATTPAIDVEQTTIHLAWVRGPSTSKNVYYSRARPGTESVYLPVILKNFSSTMSR